MKVALVGRRLGTPGGAEESLLTLRDCLANDHDIRLFGLGEQRKQTKDAVIVPSIRQSFSGAPPFRLVRSVNSYHKLKQPLLEFEPDVIVSQHEPAIAAISVAAEIDALHVGFFRDYEAIYGRKNELINKAMSPISMVNKNIDRRIIDSLDIGICASRFLAKIYQSHWNRPFRFVYPFIDTEQYRTETTGDCITHINPRPSKGVEVTLQVAEALPDQQFLLVGSGPYPDIVTEKVPMLDNVELLGYVDDMREVYSRTKLVLMPSRWDEPFGRIPVEAGISGIPTLCSGRGGLKEAQPEVDLIVSSNTPAAYVKKIKWLEGRYDEYAEKAVQNAEARSADRQVAKLCQIISEHL